MTGKWMSASPQQSGKMCSVNIIRLACATATVVCQFQLRGTGWRVRSSGGFKPRGPRGIYSLSFTESINTQWHTVRVATPHISRLTDRDRSVGTKRSRCRKHQRSCNTNKTNHVVFLGLRAGNEGSIMQHARTRSEAVLRGSRLRYLPRRFCFFTMHRLPISRISLRLVNLSQPHSFTVVLPECRLQGKYHPRTAAGSSFETHRCSCTLSAMISRVSHMCTLLQHIPTVSVHHYLFISFWCIASLIGPRSFQPHDQDSCTEHNASHHSTSC